MRTLRLLASSLAAMFVAAGAFAASLQIDVRPVFNGDPPPSSIRSVTRNAAGETLSVTRLSFLLSGFALERADGSWLELTNQIAWMDAAQRRSFLRIDDLPPETFLQPPFPSRPRHQR